MIYWNLGQVDSSPSAREGGSKDVEAVMANVKFFGDSRHDRDGFETSALKHTLVDIRTIEGSVTGHWAALRIQVSRLPS